MSALVSFLRELGRTGATDYPYPDPMGDAANRIEKLEAALRLIVEMDGDQPARSDWDMVRIARKALGDAA